MTDDGMSDERVDETFRDALHGALESWLNSGENLSEILERTAYKLNVEYDDLDIERLHHTHESAKEALLDCVTGLNSERGGRSETPPQQRRERDKGFSR